MLIRKNIFFMILVIILSFFCIEVGAEAAVHLPKTMQGTGGVLTPYTALSVAKVTKESNSKAPNTPYTFTPIVTYRIKARAGAHGSITPSGKVIVIEGVSQTFTIRPDNGYRIADVKVDGVSQGRVPIYTFRTVTANHKITATFIKTDEGEGQTEFYSALPPGRTFIGGGGYGNVPGGVDEGNGRMIEEGDIVQVYEHALFVLNQYRGLQIIDVADTNNPILLSTVPIYGSPVELYVRDSTAYVVVSNYYNFWYNPARVSTESFQGSQIAIVDVRDKRSPQILGGIEINGFITDTRIVGNILYTVANRYAYAPMGSENLTTIASVSIADPSQVAIVDEMTFQRPNGFSENNVQVTEDKIFLAQYTWGYTDSNGNWVENAATDITCIDISDEQGVIRRGKTFTVPGVVLNRWQMDFYNGYFRAITPEQYWGNGFPSLYIYKVENPNTIEPVSSLPLIIDRPESLSSVRFDGDQAYAVTYERVDPLFTLDLHDPEHPRQLAEIQMSGWIDYIEPRTDHLVTLGHDDAEGTMSLAVTLFDVTSIDNPILVQRVNFGEGYGWVPTEINDIHKAFKVLDDVHLILVPFSSWSSLENTEISGVQLIDYFFDVNTKALVKRGLIDHSGWVERAVPYDNATVFTVSNEAFQSVDISNRDNPEIKKILELARNAIAINQLTPDTGLELSTNDQWFSYGQSKSKLSVVPLDDPNTPEPADAMEIAGYCDQLFSMQGCNVLVGYKYDEEKGNVTLLKTVTHDGTTFRMLGSLEIEGLNNSGGVLYANYRSLYPYYRPSVQAVKLSDTAMVLTGNEWYYPVMMGNSNSYPMVMKTVDVSDPQRLTVASTVNIELPDGGYITHTLWDGYKAYISYALPFTDEQGSSYYRCYCKIVDFSDLENPVVSLPINVPGNVVGRSNNGQFVYTIDYQYASPPYEASNEVYLNTLEIIGDLAYLKDREKIVPAPTSDQEYYYCGNVVVNNEKAYFIVTHTMCEPDYSQCQDLSQLVTADLFDPENIQFPSSQNLEAQGTDIVNVVQNKLFIYTYSGASGIIIYSLDNPLVPSFETFYRTDSYPEKIVIINDKAYLPSGMYGIKVIELH